jgi:phage/plasmid-associated DNA primase
MVTIENHSPGGISLVESQFPSPSELWADDPIMAMADSSVRSQKVSLGYKITDALLSIFGQQIWATLYGETYLWTGSYYKLKTQEEVTTIVEKWWSKVYPDTFFIKHGNEVYNRLKQRNNIPLEKLNCPNHLVPFQNGYYDITHRCFLKGCNSAYHFTEGFDFPFQEIKATAKWQDKPVLFLYHIFQLFPKDPKIQNELMTALCYSVTHNIDYQIGFTLLGKSNCGKSTLMEIMQELVELAHFSDFNPLGFDKQEKELMYGYTADALITNCDEIESSAYWSSDVIGGLKHLITATYISSRKRFGQLTKKKNYSHLWITANYLPRLYSYDDGFCRRWFCWFSEASYTHNKDLQRKKDIMEYEREKIICYLFTNFSDFTGLLNFDEEFNKDFWQKYASNMYSFIQAQCTLNKNCSIPTDKLYESYCEFCESAVSKEKALSSKYFGQYLHRIGIKTKVIGHEKIYIYDGICLKTQVFGDKSIENIEPPLKEELEKESEDISKLLDLVEKEDRELRGN